MQRSERIDGRKTDGSGDEEPHGAPAAHAKSTPAGRRRGQFLPGNKGGPGRPKAALEARYLKALRANCDLERFGELVKVVVDRAIKGDIQAAKLLFDRFVPAGRLDELKGQALGVNRLVVESSELERRREWLREIIVR